MKVGLLIKVGEALYGARWRTAIASDLGITYRTIARYQSAGEMPDDMVDRLKPVVRFRIEAAEAARKLLWSDRRS